MKRSEDDYRNIPLVPVLNGALAFFHRPSKGGLSILKQAGCNCVITLQSKTEMPEEIESFCKELGMKWIWVNLQGANKRLLESNNTAWLIREALCQAHDLLKSGFRILVHCAAGIHRTGLFSYALLRIAGHDKDATLEIMQRIRPVTYERCGSFRLELGESLAQKILNEGIHVEIPEFAGMTSSKRIEEPLIFARITPTHMGKLRFECVVCDRGIMIYALGPCVNLEINFEYLKDKVGNEWVARKEAKFLPGGVNKNFKKFEKELCQVFKECFDKGLACWAGAKIEDDLIFVKAFWPEVIEYTSDRLLKTSDVQQETIYQEILDFKQNLRN